MRMMRSTRKVGALLGETPLLVESPPSSPTESYPYHYPSRSSPSAQSSRAGSVHTYPSRSSSLSLSPTSPTAYRGPSSPTRATARPMLIVQPPVSAPYPHYPAHTAYPTPHPATFTAAPVPHIENSRRRKMAKVVQTLGAHVPPELVFPPARNSPRRADTFSVFETPPYEQRPIPEPARRTRASTLPADRPSSSRAQSRMMMPSVPEGRAAYHTRRFARPSLPQAKWNIPEGAGLERGVERRR
ncbi:hypothetical protein C8R43DRAFT_1156707 [Mycena crocata]|nr:hypothetical protein C8R43DRAFT_1156707 [Mycena crocata]